MVLIVVVMEAADRVQVVDGVVVVVVAGAVVAVVAVEVTFQAIVGAARVVTVVVGEAGAPTVALR